VAALALLSYEVYSSCVRIILIYARTIISDIVATGKLLQDCRVISSDLGHHAPL
jgi:hypothetical protein